MDPLLQAEFGQQPLCEAANIGLIGLRGLLQMRKCLFFLTRIGQNRSEIELCPGVCWIEADGFAVFASSFFHILFTLENVAPNVVASGESGLMFTAAFACCSAASFAP